MGLLEIGIGLFIFLIFIFTQRKLLSELFGGIKALLNQVMKDYITYRKHRGSNKK